MTDDASGQAVIASMFQDTGDAFSVSSPHTGLLWALETLAWSPVHAPAAISLLARLAELDPGGRLSNRPLNSLENIFRSWMPQTSLTAPRRLTVIDALRRDHPDVAWKLMLQLLPEHHSVGHYTHSPRFRDWKLPQQRMTYEEVWSFNTSVAERILEDVEVDPQRWAELVERIERVPPAERTRALEKIRTIASDLAPELREHLWRRLDETSRQHRTFASAEWALPADQVADLEETANELAPADPISATGWLFDAHLPSLGEERLEYRAQEARVAEARGEAVRAILDTSGTTGLLELAERTKNPHFVGAAAAAVTSQELDHQLLPLLDSSIPSAAALAAGFASTRTRTEDESWLREELSKLEGKPLAQSRLLQMEDDVELAWRLLATLPEDVYDNYWQEFSVYGRGDFQHVNEAARSLLEAGRTVAALDLMSLYVGKEDRRVDPALIVEALRALMALEPESVELGHLASYELGELLSYLRATAIDDETLGVLEWQLRPALGFGAQSPTLERRLARDPEFFVEIVSLVYKPRHTDQPASVSEAIASNAYQLLDEWRIVPGSSEPVSHVDETELASWLDRARQRLREVDRREVGDIHIGKVFAHSRADDDGTWPTLPVRNAIERLGSPEVAEGFRIQTFNNRGTTTRGIFEGGAQERALAERYAELAAAIRDGWPTTAAVLHELAADYERQAAQMDEEVERLRHGMPR